MHNLIIYKFNSLYHILKEIEKDLNFMVLEISDVKSLHEQIKSLDNYLIITRDRNLDLINQIILKDFPIKIKKLIERLNIEFLKLKFSNQSKIRIKDYIIDLNSRMISSNNSNLKLTEKEINTIIYLSNSNQPISIKELQGAVWGYQSNMETHTVETHVYRLRKKILNIFKDKNFLVSKKDGYFIN